MVKITKKKKTEKKSSSHGENSSKEAKKTRDSNPTVKITPDATSLNTTDKTYPKYNAKEKNNIIRIYIKEIKNFYLLVSYSPSSGKMNMTI